MFSFMFLCIVAVSARSATKEKIVNGADAIHGRQLHQVAMVSSARSTSISCGGSLIRPDAVLTAGHCVNGRRLSSIYFKVNAHNLNDNGGDVETIGARKCVMDPSYNDGSGGFTPHDIAICFLTKSANVAHTIDLAQVGEVPVGHTCYITGWGRLSGDGTLPYQLQETSGTILSTSACKTPYGSSVTPNNICIHNSNTGACNGDSGGPMTCWVQKGDKMIPVVAGVTSFGKTGCLTSAPSVYTRVSTYLGFIANTLAANPQV